jgi:hypothetical protein
LRESGTQVRAEFCQIRPHLKALAIFTNSVVQIVRAVELYRMHADFARTLGDKKTREEAENYSKTHTAGG